MTKEGRLQPECDWILQESTVFTPRLGQFKGSNPTALADPEVTILVVPGGECCQSKLMARASREALHEAEATLVPRP